MERIPITDQSGYWFNKDTATKYDEQTHDNGNMIISLATGSSTNHERLYKSEAGNWFLQIFSSVKGINPATVQITIEEAVSWFCKQRFDLNEMPPEISERAGMFQL
jgi:hypothetical protein